MLDVLASILLGLAVLVHPMPKKILAGGQMIYHFDPPEPGLDEAGGWYHYLVNSWLVIDGSLGSVSAPNALILNFDRRPFHWGAAGAGVVAPVTPGLPHTIAMMVNNDRTRDVGDGDAVKLRVKFYDLPSFNLLGDFQLLKTEVASGWQLWSPGSIQPTGSTVEIQLTAEGGPVGCVAYWGVDDFAISEQGGNEMAVMLTEYAVRAVLSRLQAVGQGLNEEIAFVESEARVSVGGGNYLDLPTVKGWRSFDPGIATPDTVEVEVFESGDITFPSQSYDQSTWTGGRTRILSKVPLRIALNHANRGNADAGNATLLASQMNTRSRLYMAALVRTIRNDPTCGTSAVICVPASARSKVLQPQRADTDSRRVGRVEFDIEVRLQESSANEMTQGAGSLPTVTTMETP